MEYNWNIATPTPQQTCIVLAEELNITTTEAWLLVRRDISTPQQAKDYVRPHQDRLDKDRAYDPFLMKNMDKAVQRLDTAIRQKEKILICGDYDVDGVTSVTLLYAFLNKLSPNNILFYLPDRYKEGYGVSRQSIDYANAEQCKLIITIDCGITETDNLAYAQFLNMDVIVCDHHNVGPQLPPAHAILNMKQHDCTYPFKDLSGCGVGFKLVQAYAKKHDIPFEQIKPLLQLVALSIACDIVSMTGENRIMEYLGLIEMQRTPIMGLSALLNIAGCTQSNISVDDLAFRLGPRINACGRLHSAHTALQLLLTENKEEAVQLANTINNYNTERQNEEKEALDEVLKQIKLIPDFEHLHSTVVFAPNLQKGVLGIVASHLQEYYYRPTIVLSENPNGELTGSARSINNLNLYNAINECRQLLLKFGGHSHAAGLSLKKENIDIFRQQLDNVISKQITPDMTIPTLQIDAQITLNEITEKMYRIIRRLAPFGPHNPNPLFVTQHLTDTGYSRKVGKNAEHLKLSLQDNNGNTIEGIAFRKAEWLDYLETRKPVSVCYHIDKNEFNGNSNLQLIVQDIKKE